MLVLAIDIGGTFTDLVGFDPTRGALIQAKSSTTPENLARGVLDCVEKSGAGVADAERLIHGSTVAINTLIERKGARTALLVTRGTRDCYAIGRGNHPDAFNLRYMRPRPLVTSENVFEVDERLYANGLVRHPIREQQIADIAATIRAGGFDAVAVCFLHAYANSEHESIAGRVLARELPDVYISLSHELMREYREYERTSTTVVNAYVGPKVSGYVRNLDSELKTCGFAGELSIMQSNGGVMAPAVAQQRPVTMMESGPVGGIIASAEVGKALGCPNVISFDMGGTTAKASLILDGTPAMADGYYVNGYDSGDPVMIPVVDVVEVGTGGGSIGWIDEVGGLKVGPRSAGARPGPICYGRGGDQPTITDANLVLGRLGAREFLGGEMHLDAAAAEAGIRDRIAQPLGLETAVAARAIVAIAVAKMSLAVRQVSVHQGHDPREFAMVASGGAGPLHGVAVAKDLHIPTVIIPNLPSHFSAVGMLLADEVHNRVRTYYAPIDTCEFAAVDRIVEELEREVRSITRSPQAEHTLALDLRYVGQEFSLTVPVTREQIRGARREDIRRAFDELHEHRYSHHAANEPVEMINIRLLARAKGPKLAMPGASHATAPCRYRPAFMMSGPAIDLPVYRREQLAVGATVAGSALIEEYGTTTVLYAGDSLTVAATGELIIMVGA